MNNKNFKHKKWFENKQCSICKQPGSIFRFIRGKSFILCDKKECDLINRVKMGFFGTPLKIKGE